MSNDLNSCSFIGRLGKDPEVRFMTNGKAVASFSIAVGSQWKDKQTGEKQVSTEWVNITAFDKLGEICGEYLKKGSQVFISGRMKTEKYQDKETGADRYSTKIIADNMQMLSGKRDNEPAQDAHSTAKSDGYAQQEPASSTARPALGFGSFDDCIPFNRAGACGLWRVM